MPISEEERKRFVVLSEECAEIIQIASKIQRFGFESSHPNDPEITNRMLLEREISDLLAVIELLTVNKNIDSERVQNGIQPKIDKLKRYGIT